MNSQEESIFFALIRAAIWKRPVDVSIPPDFKWDAVLDALEKHTLLAVVADTISKLPSESKPSEERLQSICVYTANLLRSRIYFRSVIKQLFIVLTTHGIQPILLKGEQLACLYPSECVRSVGDIDILVSVKEYELSKKILSNEGVIFEDTQDIYHITGYYDDIVIELHYKPGISAVSLNNTLYLNLFSDKTYYGPATILVDDVTIPVLDCQTSLIFLFNHICSHMLHGGLGVRQFVDLALFVKKIEDHINWQIFNYNINKLELSKAWQYTYRFMQKELGLNSNLQIQAHYIDCDYQRFIRLILNSWNFGELTKEPKFYDKTKLGYLIKLVQNAIRYQFIFPHISIKELTYFIHNWLKRRVKMMFNKDKASYVNS